MSGGRFDYKDQGLRNEIFGWGDTWCNVFEDREISELVWDVLNLVHEFDWYDSGDTGEDTWLKEKVAFKEKWLSSNNVDRVKRIIDDTFRDAKEELYKTFDIGDVAEVKNYWRPRDEALPGTSTTCTSASDVAERQVRA